jgi:glyoxylase-like metal-dependent hydrolase (beta-lactamase superfamily II)
MPGAMGRWNGGVFSGGQCVLAGNPGPMTLDGTNTWLLDIDDESVVVVDPGPDDEGHLAAVSDALGDRRVRDILLTHGHLDHSAAALSFAGAFGASVRALDWQPGHERLAPGEVLDYGDVAIHVVATPGHTHDSVSLHMPTMAALLTGDTILGRGTTVVAHPDGRLQDYLESLRRLQDLVERVGATRVWPGHGPALPDAAEVIEAYLEHRQQRLNEVSRAVADLPPGPGLARAVVERVYADVPEVLWPAAELSVLAQLEYLGH